MAAVEALAAVEAVGMAAEASSTVAGEVGGAAVGGARRGSIRHARRRARRLSAGCSERPTSAPRTATTETDVARATRRPRAEASHSRVTAVPTTPSAIDQSETSARIDRQTTTTMSDMNDSMRDLMSGSRRLGGGAERRRGAATTWTRVATAGVSRSVLLIMMSGKTTRDT